MIGQLFRLTGRGLADLRLHPFAQLLTLVAVAMVTLLIGVILTGLHNVNLELLKSRGRAEFQIYWKQGADVDAVSRDVETIGSLDHLSELKTFTPSDALTELAGTLGQAGDFSWLADTNPLPYTALVSFAVPPENQEQGWAGDLLSRIKSLPGVETVTYTPLQPDLGQGWISLSRAIVWPLLGFLALVVALVVHNTIKLSLLTRMDEVEILALVGAKPWFIRWPLLTGGLVQGLLGSAAGIGLLRSLFLFTQDALNFPPLFIRLEFLPMEYALILGGAVTLVSTASSWVAVR